MSKVERIRGQDLRALGQMGWLSRQPPDFQGRMLAIGRWIRVPGGRPLFTIGDEPDAIFGLGSGFLDISLPVDSDSDVVILRAPPGLWIGDGSLLTGGRRGLTVTAATDCEVFRVPGGPLRRMLEENPADWQFFYRLLSQNAQMATELLAEALALPARPRLARLMLRLLQPDGTLDATQEDLGRMVGMSRAAFRRAFGDLIAAGVLETGRSRVLIHDRDALIREARLRD